MHAALLYSFLNIHLLNIYWAPTKCQVPSVLSLSSMANSLRPAQTHILPIPVSPMVPSTVACYAGSIQQMLRIQMMLHLCSKPLMTPNACVIQSKFLSWHLGPLWSSPTYLHSVICHFSLTYILNSSQSRHLIFPKTALHLCLCLYGVHWTVLSPFTSACLFLPTVLPDSPQMCFSMKPFLVDLNGQAVSYTHLTLPTNSLV